MACKQLSVSELNTLIKFSLESDGIFHDIWVCGEITQFRHYQKGNHYYFYLTEGKASINCVMYTSSVNALSFQPTVGQLVYARGKIIFFKNKGTVMFQVAYMTPDGTGDQRKDLKALTTLFEKEGLFDDSHKKTCPSYPETIGLITTPDSAAMGDFVSTLRRDNRYSEISLFPAVMQGEHAPLSIIENLDYAAQRGVDVVAVVRGGGSAQELSVFHDERLCRYLFDFPIPVVCGIGHQTDSHLIDRIVDYSAVTPTACAAYLADSFSQIHDRIAVSLENIEQHILHCLEQLLHDAQACFSELQSSVEQRILFSDQRIRQLCDAIARSNPLLKLSLGYSITTHDDSPLRSVTNIGKGDTIRTRLGDGEIKSLVEEVVHGYKKNDI